MKMDLVIVICFDTRASMLDSDGRQAIIKLQALGHPYIHEDMKQNKVRRASMYRIP